MAKADGRIDADRDLTTFVVDGDLTAAEIVQYSSEYYEESPTRSVLWDATSGTVNGISSEELRNVAKRMLNHTKRRSGGKTALVGRFDIDFGLARQYEAYAKMEQLPVQYQIFRNVEEAMERLEL